MVITYNHVQYSNNRSLRYWENPDFKTSVSIVPTSALTGEGVPDLLYMILKLTQDWMVDKLEVKEDAAKVLCQGTSLS